MSYLKFYKLIDDFDLDFLIKTFLCSKNLVCELCITSEGKNDKEQ